MIKFIKNAIYALAAITTLNGCGGDMFPQYSGKYELISSSYSNPNFKGEKSLAKHLIITDRMEFKGSHWDHRLKIGFTAANPDEADGNIALSLDKLVNVDKGVYPNNGFDGVKIWDEGKVDGGAFCNYQYNYYLFMESVPDSTILKEVYPNRGPFIKIDPATGNKIYESLMYPENVELDQDAVNRWYNSIGNNSGITLVLKFSRYIDSDLTGCDENSYLVYDSENRGSAELIFIYHSISESQETDIRKAGFDYIKEDIKPSIIFFNDIVSGIKL